MVVNVTCGKNSFVKYAACCENFIPFLVVGLENMQPPWALSSHKTLHHNIKTETDTSKF